MDILRTEEMLNFALFQYPRESKNAPGFPAAFEMNVIIRNDSLTSREHRTKDCL